FDRQSRRLHGGGRQGRHGVGLGMKELRVKEQRGRAMADSSILIRTLALGSLLGALACVDHRPIHNGLLDEHVYVAKQDLTGDNPKLERPNDGWLFKTTVVKTSSPNFLGDYAFPGFESGTQYVRFQFKEDKLQVTDGQKLQQDDADNPNDDLATNANRVLFEFDGQHVDVQLRESLDG